MKGEESKYSADFLNQLVSRLKEQYKSDPNIFHVSWGRGKAGDRSKGICIIFLVKQKISSEKARAAIGTSTVPPEIEGIPTDVKERNIKKLASAVGSRGDVIADPLNGGWSTSNADNHIVWFNGWGTIAILCTDNNNGDLLALSNWHVWADGGEEGDTIIQPGIPRAGDVVENTTKVLACGPLFSSLLEWELPDPLAVGLYGGAAAAAIAAACSDYRDPSRRGQDATIPAQNEKTVRERVKVATEYLDLPVPGTPFRTDVKWEYERETTGNNYYHGVQEEQINAQFLLGKYVTSSKSQYQPGEKAIIYAAIWDYQPRSCDSYHVIAHLIPELAPNTSYPLVLHPIPCPRNVPWYPTADPKGKKICYDFGKLKPGTKYPSRYSFDWLHCSSIDHSLLVITNWVNNQQGQGELRIPSKGLRFRHNPCRTVEVKLTGFTKTPITAIAFDIQGNVLDSQRSSGQNGSIEDLILSGEGIAEVILRGGGDEGVLVQYCADTNLLSEMEHKLKAEVIMRLKDVAHVPFKNLDREKVRTTRCCFGGVFQIPPILPAGRWNVYLTVQNINPVPQGTKPEVAAATIGGHFLTVPAAQVAGCAFMMLGDHVFDIF